MGEMEVPADALYGASTQRAVLNFPISGQRFPRRFIRALALIKQAAAETNAELGLLDADVAEAIAAAAARGRRRRPRRPVPDRRLPDRLRHVDEHEHERGRRPPRRGAAGAAAARSTRTTTSTAARSSNDTIPTAMQLAGGDGDRGGAAAGARDAPATALGAKAERALAGRQDRPDAPPGRDADPPRPGVPRLRRPGRGVDPPGPSRPGRAARPCRSAGRPSGPGINAHPRVRRAGLRPAVGADRPRRPRDGATTSTPRRRSMP